MRPRIVSFLLSHHIHLYVPTYNFFYLCLIICALLLSIKLGKREGHSIQIMIIITLNITILAIIGARVYGMLLNYLMFENFPSLSLSIFDTKTGSFGAYVGGVVGAIISTKIVKINPIKIIDIYAPIIAISIFWGRIGCFLSGCCYGKISSLPWSVSFPNSSIVYLNQRIEGLLSPHAQLSIPVHPTQLYESFFGILLFIYLLQLSNKKTGTGVRSSIFFISYFCFRFIIEFFRGDGYELNSLISLQQIISLTIVILIIIYYVLCRIKFSNK